MSRLPLCLTPGDPTGIGPEIVVKFLNDCIQKKQLQPVIVIGSLKALKDQAELCKIPFPEHELITYQDVDPKNKLLPGEVSYQALVLAVEVIANQKARGLVTGPISKENLHAAGIAYSGHTEILQDLANQYFPTETPHQSEMLFIYEQFRMLLLTRHIALKDVSTELTSERAYQSLNTVLAFLKNTLKLDSPKLGILGVNPHAGEMQKLGEFCEERDVIQPVLDKLSQKWNVLIDPPLAADAAFRGFEAKNPTYDCYVAAYHDQGLIPMKLVAGMNAVNVTIGLPFLRTSVSHGTAPDIANKNQADPTALHVAFNLADELLN